MESYAKFDIKRINPLISLATIVLMLTVYRVTDLYFQNGPSFTSVLMDMAGHIFGSLNDACHAADHDNCTALISYCLPDFTILNLIITLTSIVAIICLYRILFHPYRQVRNLGDVGYITDGRNKKEVANEIRKRRRAGDVPPVYPNGWFSLLRSWELKTADVKYVSALGQELAVYRGEDGKAYIVDAYCPHLGANLGVGGQVKGDCIECPFHGWVFKGTDGKCVDIPYTKKVPDFAQTRAWRCREVNGEIFIWFHAEGEEPDWEPPEVEGITNGTMKYHGFTEHYVNAHIEEIPENAADLAHLQHLHSPFVADGQDLRATNANSRPWQWIQHRWNGIWDTSKDDKHIGVMTLSHEMTLFGCTIPYTYMNVEACQIGPGLVHLQFSHPFLGDVILVQTVLPIQPLTQRLVHCIYSTGTRPAAKVALCMESIQVERDVMIWNHKTYQSKPLLVKEESLIAKHRRWYSQFYSEHSPRYAARKDTLEW